MAEQRRQERERAADLAKRKVEDERKNVEVQKEL